MARHRMTNHEYEQLRDAIRTMRAENPELTPREACDTVNKKLAKPMTYSAFWKQWRLAEPKRNGRRASSASSNDVEKQARAVVHVGTANGATPSDGQRSRIRVLLVEAEIGEADLDNIAQAIGAFVAGRS